MKLTNTYQCDLKHINKLLDKCWVFAEKKGAEKQLLVNQQYANKDLIVGRQLANNFLTTFNKILWELFFTFAKFLTGFTMGIALHDHSWQT